MVDITIKNIPEGAEKSVKQMVSIAVERFYRKELVVTEEKQTTFETNVDNFLEANSMSKKFDIEEPVKEPIEEIK